LFSLLSVCIVNNAAAIPISVSARGSVTAVLAPDAFGTQVGDSISLHAEFDSAALVDVPEFFGISIPGVQFASLASPQSSLIIQLGTRTWTALDEPLYGSDLFGIFPTALPHVVLRDGKFMGLNFFGIGPGDDVFVNDAVGQLYFGSPLGQILGGNSDPESPPFWLGMWDLRDATVSVPEPGTSALFALGLGALAILRRRPRA